MTIRRFVPRLMPRGTRPTGPHQPLVRRADTVADRRMRHRIARSFVVELAGAGVEELGVGRTTGVAQRPDVRTGLAEADEDRFGSCDAIVVTELTCEACAAYCPASLATTGATVSAKLAPMTK